MTGLSFPKVILQEMNVAKEGLQATKKQWIQAGYFTP